MKKALLLSTSLVLGAASIASAGGLGDPVMTKDTIEQGTSSSSHDFIVPLFLLLTIAAVVSSSNGSAGGGLGGLSDIRLKEDISLIGMTPQGLPLYRYRYKGLPEVWQGVMAQDVAMVRPDAIIDGPFGYMAVDYAKLGLKMRRVH